MRRFALFAIVILIGCSRCPARKCPGYNNGDFSCSVEITDPNDYTRHEIEDTVSKYDPLSVNIDYPSDGPSQALSFYSDRVDIPPLLETTFCKGCLELRVMATFGYRQMFALIIQKVGDKWRGYRIPSAVCQRVIEMEMPSSHWEALWKKLKAGGIEDLRGTSSQEDILLMRDGVTYHVELKNQNQYQYYYYTDPAHQKFDDAKVFMNLMQELENGFEEARSVQDE